MPGYITLWPPHVVACVFVCVISPCHPVCHLLQSHCRSLPMTHCQQSRNACPASGAPCTRQEASPSAPRPRPTQEWAEHGSGYRPGSWLRVSAGCTPVSARLGSGMTRSLSDNKRTMRAHAYHHVSRCSMWLHLETYLRHALSTVPQRRRMSSKPRPRQLRPGLPRTAS